MPLESVSLDLALLLVWDLQQPMLKTHILM
jgi:hypothetical protein